jgi:hypothetical protein
MWLRLHPLVARRQPPRLAGRQHARGVRVAAALRVALGRDQHVLAERGQSAPAERASVRRGLEVLGAANRPPGGLCVTHPSKHRTGAAARAIVGPAMEHRDEQIIVETDRYRITGMLRLPRDGYRSRLTDYLNASERSFLPLTDVELVPLDADGHSERRPFMALSLRHIVLAMPSGGVGVGVGVEGESAVS